MIDLSLFQQACKLLPLGVFIVDKDLSFLFWNQWLENKSKLNEKSVLGKKFEELFPDVKSARFEWAVEQVIEYKNPQVLSQILNSHLLPLKLGKEISEEHEYMPQHVEIIPLELDKETYAMVTITDVTESVFQKKTLFEMAYNLEEDSFHDTLTNCYNRRFLRRWIGEQFKLAKIQQFGISCCLFDLDNFKPINDKYGHEVGDRVLKDFVNLVESLLRNTDIFVRYGGEEFVLMLPMCPAKKALSIAENIRSALEQESIAGLIRGKITCSIGVAEWDCKNPVDAEVLVKMADEAMYCAKTQGKNQVQIYNH